MKRFGPLFATVLALGCSTEGDDSGTFGAGAGTGTGATGNTGSGGAAGSGLGAFGGSSDGGGSGGSETIEGDPKTCAQANETASYVGCSFWPTVTGNSVWEVFDFVAVVANAGDTTANVEVRLGPDVIRTAQVLPNGLQKIYLPWIPKLKGPQADACGSSSLNTASVNAKRAAFHLTSDAPVTVYQFNALEYQGAGGPAGKNWASCLGNQPCPQTFLPVGCFSFSNDASLLLPSTTLTTNYRVMGVHGLDIGGGQGIGSYVSITATEDNTEVTFQSTARTFAGGSLPAMTPGQSRSLTMQAGDVEQIVAEPTSDLSGSLVQSTKPVQVIAGIPCVQTPLGVQACDHIEESVFPAETLGTRYFVTRPTGPTGGAVQHVVKIYGNVDGTALTYPSGPPAGAPSMINAGQVADLGVVNQDFEVTGTSEFGVGMFMVGGELLGGAVGEAKGDPSFTLASSVEQYRTKYVFLAPDDYDASYVDIVMPMTAGVTIDGSPVPAPTPIGGSGFGIARAKLTNANGGHHVLNSSEAVGIQVMGYGSYTSYHYPGGLDLQAIAPPPPPIK